MVERTRLAILAAVIAAAVVLGALVAKMLLDELGVDWRIPAYIGLVVGVGFWIIDALTEPWEPERVEGEIVDE